VAQARPRYLRLVHSPLQQGVQLQQGVNGVESRLMTVPGAWFRLIPARSGSAGARLPLRLEVLVGERGRAAVGRLDDDEGMVGGGVARVAFPRHASISFCELALPLSRC